MNEPADLAARQRFARELDRNFSVIAAAGSGKTRAITDRIVEIARGDAALEHLPQLVVVTYTNRAADEMQQRTRQRILEAGLSLEVIEAFNRAYFGTIHSFCMKLLAAHGHHLGLTASLELVTDDDELWNQFVQQQTTVGQSLGEENRRVLLRHVQVRDLMEMARKWPGEFSAVEPGTACPDTDFSEIYAVVATGSSKRTIPNDQDALRSWEERWRKDNGFAPWPPRSSQAREFTALWHDAFRPLRDWVSACALCVAAEVQRAYRDFRFERGVVTYADQVALAVELTRQPEIVRRIREKNYRVILDEAQDTNPQQFRLLLEVTRPPQAAGVWREELQGPPRPGHFCMVGDFQQSIYHDPADLARYRELHETLITEGAAEELTFSVTFRLDRAQLDFVNAVFPTILNRDEGQVPFVELNARPGILTGQFVRLDLDGEVDLDLPESQRAAQEARELAAWVRAAGLEKLRADSWRQVAILSPRKAWLRPLREALLALDLPAEVQSESDLEADNPAYAWLTALLAVMVDPNDNYELVGVLREVFGLSDDELARFAQGNGHRFQIATRTSERGAVPDTLNLLARVRLTIPHQPLFSAVQEIVRMTQLRERLRSLPAEVFPDLVADLEKLLSVAGTAEARGDSLADFARGLRTNYSATRETLPAQTDAIQLITAHKAKGSEWQAVIVPFLTRKVWGPTPRYPSLVQTVEEEQPQIVFDKTDSDELKRSRELAERQKMERLLYVALTRAKHTVVLAVDRQFFPKAKGAIHSDSQIKWLRADAKEPNEKHLPALPTALQECRQTAHQQKVTPRTETRENFGRRDTGWIDQARQQAARFIRTVIPSKLATEEETSATDHDEAWIEIEPELRPARIDNPATRYGVWWHDFVQRVPWLNEPAAWDEVFAVHHATSPDMARSAREWQLLRERVSGLSDFATGWTNRTPVVRAEMPFFWKMRGDRSLEGIIDLALFDSSTGEWLILDWKTNRVARDEIETLRVNYRAQLAAYVQVVQETTGQKARAAIYSTATGEFVRYEPQEMTDEWNRLEQLPPETRFAELTER
ncbi:MAG: UvrD-helicase domain-containing protein [Chthoniobacterales bacterium]